MAASPVDPHPATVGQRREAHPATIVQRKDAHPATVAQRWEAHPATVVQQRAAHPATLFSRPGLLPSVAAPDAGAVQRFGWAVHSGSDSANQRLIVQNNLTYAGNSYRATEETTDPEQVDAPRRVDLQAGEVLHIHAHGNTANVGGFRAKSFATQLIRKFGIDALQGRTIVIHGCEVGAGQSVYARSLLNQLRSSMGSNARALVGTKVITPLRYLTVAPNGVSYVARMGTTAGDIRGVGDARDAQDRTRRIKQLSEARGAGWVAFEIGDDHRGHLSNRPIAAAALERLMRAILPAE
jgi:hypothetical protein